MNFTASSILAIVGGGLAIGGLIKPVWPLVAVGLLLVCVAVFIMSQGHN